MATLGGREWVIILVIVLLVFGAGRIGKIGSELGQGISAFRAGLKAAPTDEVLSKSSKTTGS